MSASRGWYYGAQGHASDGGRPATRGGVQWLMRQVNTGNVPGLEHSALQLADVCMSGCRPVREASLCSGV